MKGIRSPFRVEKPLTAGETVRGVLEIQKIIQELESVKKDHEELATRVQQAIEKAQAVRGERGLDGKRGLDGRHGIDGLNGKDGKDGRDGIDGIDGRDGRDGKDGKSGKDGKDGKHADPEDVVALIKKKKSLKIEHINGLEERLSPIEQKAHSAFIRGGGDTVKAGNNITISRDANGVTTINSTGGGGGGQAYSETPGGAIDGVNKTYTTLNPIGTVLSLYYNGEAIHPSEYTVSGSGFTMGTALPVISGAAFTIVYQGTSSIPTGTGLNKQVPSGTVNSINTTFTCTGIVSVAIADGTVDVDAVISGSTNSTIVYSVPPQNNVYAF